MLASVATAVVQRLQLAVGHLLEVLDIHVLLARVGKTETAGNLLIRGPGLPFVPVAFAARVVKIRVVRHLLKESPDRSKVIDLKELLPTQEGFRAFAICATVSEVATQEWQILRALVKLRWGLLPDKSGHDSSTRRLETGQEVLN